MIFTVAIDGPAAAGKGTIGRAVAAAFGFAHLDTGLLYRAVGAKGGDPVAAARSLSEADLAADGLRTLAAGQAASRVAVIPEVRAALLTFQRRFARREGGAVLDGRDIGTVICPEAEVKLYVTASPEVRAHRRWLEVGGDEAQVLAEVRERDARDTGRADAPLRAAADAVVLDTSEMGVEEAVERALAVVRERYTHFESRLADLMNQRSHSGYFAQDREILPRAQFEAGVIADWAFAARRHLGWAIDDPRGNTEDPPDGYAKVNGNPVSIELTELFNGRLNARLKEESVKSGRRVTWADAALSPEEIWWSEARFRQEVSAIVAKKVAKYSKRNLKVDVLVIYTDVPFTSAAMVEKWLASARFAPFQGIGEVHLLMGYDPSRKPGLPLFRLTEPKIA